MASAAVIIGNDGSCESTICNWGFFVSIRKELALLATGVFSVLAFIGVINFVAPVGIHSALLWEKQPWKTVSCSVERVGVAYRGNCQLHLTVSMTRQSTNFAECMNFNETRGTTKVVTENWYRSTAGQCAIQGDADYRRRTWRHSSDGTDLEEKNDVLNNVKPADLQDNFAEPGSNVDCHNEYLPWAEVSIVDPATSVIQRKCAYKFGASIPSIMNNWKQIMGVYSELLEQRERTCWILPDDECVVAFEDEHRLPDQLIRLNAVVIWEGFCCGVLALIAGCLACFWHLRDPSGSDLVPDVPCPRIDGYEKICQDPESHLPSVIREGPARPEPPPPRLSERVWNILSNVATNYHRETPPASALSTLRVHDGNRSHRTLTAVSPTRNLAADLSLEEPRGSGAL